MMHPLYGAFARLARADHHINNAETLLHEWETDCTNSLVSDHNGKAWFPNGYPPLDEAFPLITSDAIHNMRSAMDYLVFELASHDSGQVQDGTQFIIEDVKNDPANPSRGFDARAKRYLKGLTPAHVSAIEKLQPYNGVYWSKQLRDISNPDKHRHLHETIHKGRRILVTLKHGKTGRFLSGGTHMTPDGPVPEYVDIDIDGQGTIAITLDKGPIPLLPTLRELHFAVKSTIEAFKSEFK